MLCQTHQLLQPVTGLEHQQHSGHLDSLHLCINQLGHKLHQHRQERIMNSGLSVAILFGLAIFVSRGVLRVARNMQLLNSF